MASFTLFNMSVKCVLFVFSVLIPKKMTVFNTDLICVLPSCPTISNGINNDKRRVWAQRISFLALSPLGEVGEESWGRLAYLAVLGCFSQRAVYLRAKGGSCCFLWCGARTSMQFDPTAKHVLQPFQCLSLFCIGNQAPGLTFTCKAWTLLISHIPALSLNNYMGCIPWALWPKMNLIYTLKSQLSLNITETLFWWQIINYLLIGLQVRNSVFLIAPVSFPSF